MMPDLAWMLTWSLGLAVVALAYGHHVGARQARGRPITILERFRDLLILHAIGVGLMSLSYVRAYFSPFPMLPWWVTASVLRQMAAVGLGPIALWYCFALPLRLTRHLTRRRPADARTPHPLDGAWSREASFLDRIAESREPATRAVGRPIHPPSTALDRVGRLAASRPTGPDPDRPVDQA